MTAPIRAVYVTPDLVERFADYHRRNGAWGVFHVCLEDGNLKCGATGPTTDEEIALAAIFDRLSPSQRMKLGLKAERLHAQWQRRFIDGGGSLQRWYDAAPGMSAALVENASAH